MTSSTGEPLLIDGFSLTTEQVAATATLDSAAEVTISESTLNRMRAAREVIDELVDGERLIYGLNTGLGALKDERVQPEEIRQYQRNILMSHATGVGKPYASEVVRAIMLAQLNNWAQGGVGVQPEVFQLLLSMFNMGMHPVVPQVGSIGMADLAQMAHLSLPLIGLGEVEYQGRAMPASEGLEAAGLAPVVMGAKDGIASVSTNAASSGHAALVVEKFRYLAHLFDLSAALAYEGFRAHVDILDPIFDARLTSEEAQTMQHIRGLLAGSHLFNVQHKTVQDPISFRSVLRVHAALLKSLAFAKDAVETELNSPGENPTVFADERVMLPSGNYHPAALATAMDTLVLAFTQAASLAANRVLRLNTPHFSGLPGQLTEQPGLNLGFAVVQKTVTSLFAEIRHLANPASLDMLPVADGIEDHATNAAFVVQKADLAAEKLMYIAAIELLTSAQAIDLRGDADNLGQGTRALYAAVRNEVPYLPIDAPIAPHIEALFRLIKGRQLPKLSIG